MKVILICHEINKKKWFDICKSLHFIIIVCDSQIIDCEIHSAANKKCLIFFDTHGFDEKTVLVNLKKYSTQHLAVIDSQTNYASLIIRNSQEFQVNDYIQGIVETKHIEEAIQRYQKCLEDEPTDMVVGEYFVVKDRGESTFINLNNITVLEGLGAYTKVHSVNKQYIVSKNLKKLLEQLPKCFIRTHRSFAVHIKHINSLSGNQVLLHNGESVKASKSGKKILISRFSVA